VLTVFGGGDVTQRLIRPAAMDLGVLLDIYDISPVPHASLYDGTVSNVPLSPVVVVATPTETHLDLVSELNDVGCHVVCEKPLTLTSEGLSVLDSSPQLLDNVFVLSYYALEKSLPLTFLLTQRDLYSDFLYSSGLDARDVYSILGRVRSVSFSFKEPTDGGVSSLREMEDLVFHVFMLISQLSRSGEVGLQMAAAEFTSRDGVGSLRLDGRACSPEGGFPFFAIVERGGVVKRRVVSVVFEGGQVEVDCDSRSACVFDKRGKVLWRSRVMDSFLSYQVQLLLVSRWVHSGGSPRSYDLYGDVVSASRLWLELKRVCFPELKV